MERAQNILFVEFGHKIIWVFFFSLFFFFFCVYDGAGLGLEGRQGFVGVASLVGKTTAWILYSFIMVFI